MTCYMSTNTFCLRKTSNVISFFTNLPLSDNLQCFEEHSSYRGLSLPWIRPHKHMTAPQTRSERTMISNTASVYTGTLHGLIEMSLQNICEPCWEKELCVILKSRARCCVWFVAWWLWSCWRDEHHPSGHFQLHHGLEKPETAQDW